MSKLDKEAALIAQLKTVAVDLRRGVETLRKAAKKVPNNLDPFTTRLRTAVGEMAEQVDLADLWIGFLEKIVKREEAQRSK